MKHFSIHLQISFVLLSKNSLLEERCKKSPVIHITGLPFLIYANVCFLLKQ